MSQFKGTYVFKQGGVEIGRSSNLITSNGRKMILQFLSGNRPDWAADMAIGAMPTPSPTVADTQLNFETSRYPVTLKSFISAGMDGINPDLIVVRASLPSNLYANIYEIGLYATSSAKYSTSTRNNVVLSDFSNLSDWSATGPAVIPNAYVPQGYGSPRIGANSVSFMPSTTYTNSKLSIGFSNYTALDSLQLLLFNTASTTGASGTITIVLTDSSNTTQTLVFTTPNLAGYSVVSKQFTSSIINFTTITGISITTDANTYATIDAIKVLSSNEISLEESLVSKAVLTTPIAKNPNVPLDVEYYVELL